MLWVTGLIAAYVSWRAALAWGLSRLDRRAAARGWPSDYEALNAHYRLEVGQENASTEVLAAGAALKVLEETQREAESNHDHSDDFFDKLDELRARQERGEVDEDTFQHEYGVIRADFDARTEKMIAEMEESTKQIEEMQAAPKAKKYDAIESCCDGAQSKVDYLNDDIPAEAPPLPEEWRIGIADELERHAHVLPHFDRAAAIGTARYPIDFTKWPEGCGELFDAWTPLKTGARLLERMAILKADGGDLDGAVQALGKIFRLAQTLESQPTVMSQMVWMTLVSNGLRALRYVLGGGRLEGAHLGALEQMLEQVSRHDAYSAAWAGERCIIRPGFRLDKSRAEDASEESVRWYEWLLFCVPYKLAGLETLDCLQVMGEIEAGLQMASASPARKCDWIRKRASGKRRFRLPLIQTSELMALSRSHQGMTFGMECRIAKARGALVVERYRLANGKYPALPDEIAGEMPLDIYSGEPLRYRALDNGYVVYSTGAGEKEDGGHAMPRRKKRDTSFTVKWA